MLRPMRPQIAWRERSGMALALRQPSCLCGLSRRDSLDFLQVRFDYR